MIRKIELLKITHYFASHGGGIEIVAAQLARRFENAGLNVIWAASNTEGAVVDRADLPGVVLVPMACWNVVEKRIGVPFPLWSLGALFRLVGLVRRSDLVVLHDVLYLPNLWGMLCAVILRRPFVIIQHVGLVPFRNSLLRSLMALGNRTVGCWAMRKAAAVVFISGTVQQYFVTKFTGEKTHWHLIPNGVDLERFSPNISSDVMPYQTRLGACSHRFLFVGRFVQKKGLDLLRRLAAAMPEVVWFFIGSGPIDPGAWRLANVQVIGALPQSELPVWYRACDLLVLPSFGEGFPLVVQEAMACGLPVAVSSETASALAGVEEVVFHAPVCGEEEADFIVWQRLLGSLLGGNVLKDQRGVVAHFAQQNWSWECAAEDYLALFNQVLEAAPGSPGKA